MAIVKSADAKWQGGLKDGKGHISTESGVLSDTPYGFNTRFEDQKGTNPEELIAAAHAGCYSMALSMMLGEAGITANSLHTKADVTLEKVDGGFAVTRVHLTLSADIDGAEANEFLACAQQAKEGCPISKLLNAEITLDASLNDQKLAA